MDAPFHVCSSWNTMEAVDPLVLMGPACCVSVEIPRSDYAITERDIRNWEERYGDIREEEAVLIYTGHSKKWSQGRKEFIDKGYPYLAADAAAYLAEKGYGSWGRRVSVWTGKEITRTEYCWANVI